MQKELAVAEHVEQSHSGRTTGIRRRLSVVGTEAAFDEVLSQGVLAGGDRDGV
jgi:hypothetical protein